jgi:hypothetical protein
MTEAYEQLAGLVPGAASEPAAYVREIRKEQRTLTRT